MLVTTFIFSLLSSSRVHVIQTTTDRPTQNCVHISLRCHFIDTYKQTDSNAINILLALLAVNAKMLKHGTPCLYGCGSEHNSASFNTGQFYISCDDWKHYTSLRCFCQPKQGTLRFLHLNRALNCVFWWSFYNMWPVYPAKLYVDPLLASEPLPKRLYAHTAITTHAL